MQSGRRRLILRGGTALAALALVAGCTTRKDAKGQRETHLEPRYFFKVDMDRVADESRRQLVADLLRIADKLYRRNPREWQRGGFADRETALARLRDFRTHPPAELAGQQEGAAALAAFAPAFGGDRVGALLYGLLTMVDAAYEHKDEMFMLDSLNAQKFYNCARNVEIAIWKLASARDAAGAPVLLSNAIDESVHNLSFERSFGRVIGLLDFMAELLADANGRLLTRVVQTVATTLFLPVSGL
ncbi:MAG: hypothetical protein LBR88_03950 [Zoogloeaceae bacterium]|jgi:hypothetical protein|nr:hypothetical protein [Zoogloeaceae bacterium]